MAARSASRAKPVVEEAVVEEAVVEEAVVEEAVVEEAVVEEKSPQVVGSKFQPVIGIQNDKVQLGIDGKNPVSVNNPSPKAQ